MNETTDGFRGQFEFLSNMSFSPIQISYPDFNVRFPTAEHLFQSKKSSYSILNKEETSEWFVKLVNEPNPIESKRMGRELKIDIQGWNENSKVAMSNTLILKFGQNPELAKLLVETGNIELIEYNDWNDIVWGVDKTTGIGENLLGKMLMELRTKYQMQ